MRVVVAGAGFAGLIAAWRLAQGGCDVLLLEARGRVGGRVWSQQLIPGDPRTVIERGAEFVLDGYDVLRGVLREVGLDLADTVMSYYEREPRGGEPVSARQVAECAAVGGRRRGGGHARHVAGRRGRRLGRAARRAGRLPVPHRDHRRRPRRPAGRDGRVATSPSGFGRRPSWRVAGGNQRVAQELARRLGPAVRLGSPVRSVSMIAAASGCAPTTAWPPGTPPFSPSRWRCCGACPSCRRCRASSGPRGSAAGWPTTPSCICR